MNLKRLARNWQHLGETDPHWAILTDDAHRGGRWDENEFYETGVRDVEALVARLKQWQLPRLTGRALDFGCGAGRITIPLGDHFDEAVGVDIAPAMLALATKRAATKNCRFVLNEAPNLVILQDQSFDFVYSRLVLQHIPPHYTRNYLREFIRVTRPGGVIMFQLPTPTLYRVPRRRLARALPPAIVTAVRAVFRAVDRVLRPEMASFMEDYGLTQEETVSILTSRGGHILEIVPDASHGPNRPGFEYWVSIL